jgi:hypothetical protein
MQQALDVLEGLFGEYGGVAPNADQRLSIDFVEIRKMKDRESKCPKGITLVGGRWRAYRYVGGVKYNIGCFGFYQDAVNARAAAELLTEDELKKERRVKARPGGRTYEKTASELKIQAEYAKVNASAKVRTLGWAILVEGWHQAVAGAPPAYVVSM